MRERAISFSEALTKPSGPGCAGASATRAGRFVRKPFRMGMDKSFVGTKHRPIAGALEDEELARKPMLGE